MNSKVKLKILILLTLGILALSPIIININLNFNAGNSDKSSEYSDNISEDSEYLKVSKVSVPIHIDDSNPSINWSVAKDAGICTGNGTYSEPYIIEDLVIDGGDTCIWIENSEVYFRIENCTLYNSGSGILLDYVNNSQLVDNDCSSNQVGIRLDYSNNNSISGNTANNNYHGISLYHCNNNTISGNTANNNFYGIILIDSNHNTISGNNASYGMGISGGIWLSDSNYNTISGNTVNDNFYAIILTISHHNTISGNTLLGNDECIVEENCEGNVFENNDCGEGIPIELIILISIIGAGTVIGITTPLLIRRKRKRIT